MLMSIVANPYKALCVVLVIISSFLYISNVKLDRDNSTLKANTNILEQSLYSQNKTIEFLRDNTSNVNEALNNALSKNEVVSNKLTESLREVSLLRSTESRKSYEQPYQRGIFNTDMLTQRLQSITRETDTSTEQIPAP